MVEGLFDNSNKYLDSIVALDSPIHLEAMSRLRVSVSHIFTIVPDDLHRIFIEYTVEFDQQSFLILMPFIIFMNFSNVVQSTVWRKHDFLFHAIVKLVGNTSFATITKEACNLFFARKEATPVVREPTGLVNKPAEIFWRRKNVALISVATAALGGVLFNYKVALGKIFLPADIRPANAVVKAGATPSQRAGLPLTQYESFFKKAGVSLGTAIRQFVDGFSLSVFGDAAGTHQTKTTMAVAKQVVKPLKLYSFFEDFYNSVAKKNN